MNLLLTIAFLHTTAACNKSVIGIYYNTDTQSFFVDSWSLLDSGFVLVKGNVTLDVLGFLRRLGIIPSNVLYSGPLYRRIVV